MNKVSLKGVIIGSILDIVVSIILQFPVMVYALASLHLTSLPHEQIAPALMNAMQSNHTFYSLGMAGGIFGSIFGGYISARIAKHHEILNGALASFLCVISGVYTIISETYPGSIWFHVLGFILSPSLAAIGGYIRLRQVQRNSRKTGAGLADTHPA